MNDLVSRQYLLDEYDRQHQGPPGGARKIIEEAPAIEPKKGHWMRGWRYRDVYRCNLCGVWQLDDSHFCPNCGADMREGKYEDR